MFRGDVHHCGASYRNQNDRVHFYMRPPPSRKRKRENGEDFIDISRKRYSHSIPLVTGVFGVAISGKKLYILIKKCSFGLTLFWEGRQWFIEKYAKEAIRELCYLLHDKKVKQGKIESGVNVSISELKRDLETLQEVYTKSLRRY